METLIVLFWVSWVISTALSIGYDYRERFMVRDQFGRYM